MLITATHFFCSHCGLEVRRQSVDADAVNDHSSTAYFCSHRCSKLHRTSGLNVMTSMMKFDVEHAVKNGWDDKSIAFEFDLSPSLVARFAANHREKLARDKENEQKRRDDADRAYYARLRREEQKKTANQEGNDARATV